MDEYLAHEETRHGLKIKVYQDVHTDESPADWEDDTLFLVGYHQDFWVDKMVSKDLAVAIAEKEKDDPEVEKYLKNYHVFGLEAYIHSGVSLSLSYEGNYPDRRWDVSQLGLVFVKKTTARTRKKARELAQGLIATWNDYLSGNIYGFEVKTPGDELIDSCWGYYGDYNAPGGALDEARAVVDSVTHKGTTDHRGQMLLKT